MSFSLSLYRHACVLHIGTYIIVIYYIIIQSYVVFITCHHVSDILELCSTECQEWKEPDEAIWNSSEEKTAHAEGRSTRVFNIFHPPLLEGPPKDERMWVAGHVRIFVTEVLDLKYKLLSTKWRSLWLCLPFIVQVLLCSFLSAPAQVSLDSRLVQESKLPASAAFVWDWSSVFRRYRTPQGRPNDWRTQFKWPSRL